MLKPTRQDQTSNPTNIEHQAINRCQKVDEPKRLSRTPLSVRSSSLSGRHSAPAPAPSRQSTTTKIPSPKSATPPITSSTGTKTCVKGPTAMTQTDTTETERTDTETEKTVKRTRPRAEKTMKISRRGAVVHRTTLSGTTWSVRSIAR